METKQYIIFSQLVSLSTPQEQKFLFNRDIQEVEFRLRFKEN